MGHISVFASFRPRIGSRESFLELIETMITHTRQEPGCERYDLYSDDDGRFHLFEIYRDEEALQAHRDADYFTDYRAKVMDLLEEPIGVIVMTGVDTLP